MDKRLRSSARSEHELTLGRAMKSSPRRAILMHGWVCTRASPLVPYRSPDSLVHSRNEAAGSLCCDGDGIVGKMLLI